MQSVEKQIQFSVKAEGVITCFLSLVLLVILALVSVSLESARVAGARFLVENYTRMARDSVMAEYSGALFDRYHILAYNSRAGTAQGVQHALETKTAYYINRNLQAENKMMWTPVLQDVNVENYTLLSDNAGEVFRAEAAEYMKYRGTSLIIEQLLSSLGIFQGAQETVKLLEVKAATEEAVAEIDAGILELFEYVDGFVRDDTGIKQNFWGKIKVKNSFVKKLLAADPTAESTQINHPELLEAVRTHYINPKTVFSDMSAWLTEYEGAQEELTRIHQRLAELSAEDYFLRPDLKLEQTVLKAQELVYDGESLYAKHRYYGMLRAWKSTVSECEKSITKALATIEVIRTKQKLAESKVLTYGERLIEAAKWLDSSMYEDLSEGLATMRYYVGLDVEGTESIPDIDQMEKTLEQDKKIMTQMLELIGEERNESSELNIDESGRVVRMASLAAGYSHHGLKFDYSGIHLKAEGGNPADSFGELLTGGIATLVLSDSGTVSQSVLDGQELPSGKGSLFTSGEEHSSESLVWSDIMDGGASSTLSLLNNNSPFAGVAEWVTKEGSELTQQILFLGYLEEHFSNYVRAGEQTGETESVLTYEQEYIICGNAKDSQNLYEIIGKILLVRIIFNLIHVLSDAEKCGMAGETALGLLGVMGLPILVSILKFLILFVWAAEAALVETAALLQGKKLALIPLKNDFPVSFSELLLMSKTRILEKAEKMAGKTGVAFGYEEYLMLFLLLQEKESQSMRALDLIQKNVELEESGFCVTQQVCSFMVQAEYLLPELFTALPFSKRRTGGYIL